MIICSCNVISDSDIRRAVRKLRTHDPDAILTPGRVFNALNKRAQCGTCLENTIAVILNEHPDGIRKHK